MNDYGMAATSQDSSLPDYMRDFILNSIRSFITWDLVRFFHDNSHARDTAENIAKHISRDPIAVQLELRDMSQTGIIEIELVGEFEVFSLSQDAQMRSRIGQFMEACHDRNLRRLAIHQVFEGMLPS